jgi:tetratricopeptide (TPR) repeat protein
MNAVQLASVNQLAQKIKGYGNYPRLAVFLGSGASKQSGIITAVEMVSFFKEQILTQGCPSELRTDQEKDTWLRGQEWYKNEASEYCNLFGYFEPKEIGRQRYIESIVEGHDPSFGYVVLANLIANNLVNSVITTNFDDLAYSACTSYTGIRPIVYAYGVLASEMRVTAQRPKIIKMHGDYLYSTLKNTRSETALQDPNMARQVSQVLNEYGLLVIGYSGGDESVMEIFEQISEKNDLYWCVMRGEEPSDHVRQLLVEKGGFLVEIDGFDELMNDIRRNVGLNVGKMFGSIQERQDQMIESLKSFAPRYSIDILGEVVEALQNQSRQARREQVQIRKIQGLDFFTKALKAVEEGRTDDAKELYRKSIEYNPRDAAAYNNLGNILALKDPNDPEIEQCYLEAIKLTPNVMTTYTNLALRLRVQGRNQDALEFANKAFQLEPNKLQPAMHLAGLHRKLGNQLECDQYVARVREMLRPDDWYNLACLESICGNVEEALLNLRLAAEAHVLDADFAKRDPDLDWIREDPRLKPIIEAC